MGLGALRGLGKPPWAACTTGLRAPRVRRESVSGEGRQSGSEEGRRRVFVACRRVRGDRGAPR
jgi:hypothetical protein